MLTSSFAVRHRRIAGRPEGRLAGNPMDKHATGPADFPTTAMLAPEACPPYRRMPSSIL
jgi:hypothetical protein